MLNLILIGLGILGILCILSGHKESFVNITNVGKYPSSHEDTLLNYPKIGTRYCHLGKKGKCSRCNHLKRKKQNHFKQTTNNDDYRTSFEETENEFPMYKRITIAPPKPIELKGNGPRINLFNSIC